MSLYPRPTPHAPIQRLIPPQSLPQVTTIGYHANTVAIRAVLWDFDGTLADTRLKNFNVTQRILSTLHPDVAARAPVANRPEEYDRAYRRLANWREFYTRHLGFSEEETDRAGKLWSRYQLEDATPVPLFEGVCETLQCLGRRPHGVVSQNARAVIRQALSEARVEDFFGSVVGYEEVPMRRQKPAPDGILVSLRRLVDWQPGLVLFVGDHPTDARTARNANQALRESGAKIRVVSVAAAYSCGDSWREWPVQPDEAAQHPRDLLEISHRLEK